MQEIYYGDTENSTDNFYSGMARKLTKSREVTSTTSKIPQIRCKISIVIISVSTTEQERVKINEEKQVLSKLGK